MFGRVLTAMVTPFDEGGQVNYREAERIARYLAARGSDGLVIAGTTGESPNLSEEEKTDLCQAVREAVGNSCKIIAGVGTYSTKESIKATRKITASGNVDAVMAVVPYYNKPSQEGMYRHFAAIAEETSLPVMLYNIPGRSVVNLLPETVSRLAEIPNVCCLKEASGSLNQLSELKRCLPEKFVIYAGDDSLTLPMMALGAEGIISVASHVAGPQIQAMIAAFLAGRIEEAREWHLRLYPVFKGLFITSNPAPVKFLMNEMGFQAGSCQLPVAELQEGEEEFLRELLRQIRSLPLTV